MYQNRKETSKKEQQYTKKYKTKYTKFKKYITLNKQKNIIKHISSTKHQASERYCTIGYMAFEKEISFSKAI
jgi:hypothetical protein